MPKVAQPTMETPRKIPVTFTVDEDELPEVKDWQVGGKYDLHINVEQVSLSKGEEYGPAEGKGKMRARFKINSFKTMGHDKPKANYHEKMEMMKEKTKS